MRFLWVTAEAPNRHLGGGNIRQSYLLESLAIRARVDLLLATAEVREDAVVAAGIDTCTVVPVPEPRPIGRSRQRLRTLAGLTPYGPAERMEGIPSCRALRPALRELLAEEPYDAVLLQHPVLAPLLKSPRRQPWCLEIHHLASRDVQQLLALDTGARQRLVRQREVAAARRFEGWCGRMAESVITVSDEDSAALPYPTVVVPNGADLARWNALPPLAEEPRAVFTGTLGYGPNLDGVTWLCRDIWPQVRLQIPGATLEVVGRDPLPEVVALGGVNGVTVIANPPDVVPFVAKARVALVPLRFGSGTRLKAVEALASGRLVVGTSVGLEGLGLRDGIDALVADTAEGLISRMVSALQGGEALMHMPAAGRAVAMRFGWRTLGALHANHLLGLASGGPQPRQ